MARSTLLNNLSTRADGDNGLYGIHDIKIFQFEDPRHSEPDEKCILKNVSWNIRDEPSEAEDWADWAKDKSRPQPKMNLSEKLFDGPIFLGLGSLYSDRSYLVPVFNGTIYDVLSVIYEFYRMYEATHVDEEERGEMDVNDEDWTYSMSDRVWFEGLNYASPGVWWVILGS